MSGGFVFETRLFRVTAMLDRSDYSQGGCGASLRDDAAHFGRSNSHLLSSAGRVEMIFAVAASGPGECPTWIILALERDERMDRAEEERQSC
jgi:hypothetical protein